MLKEHEEHFAHQYRLAQACKLMRLYRQANGREATSPEELDSWWSSQNTTGPIVPDPEDMKAAQDTAGST